MIHRVQKSSSYWMSMYEEAVHSDLEKDYDGKYEPQYRYSLYAIISHIGEIGVGHYVVYVRYKYHDAEHWILYDGEKQCQVMEHQIFDGDDEDNKKKKKEDKPAGAIGVGPGPYQLIYERDDSWQHSPAYELIDVTLKE